MLTGVSKWKPSKLSGLMLWLDGHPSSLTVAADGTISSWADRSPYGVENMLTYSEQLDETSGGWTHIRTSVSADSIAAPDATSTADTLVDTATTNSFYLYQSPNMAAGYATASIYAKKKDYNWAWVGILSGGSTWRRCFFNISTGTKGAEKEGAIGTITDVGDGWYRLSCYGERATSGADVVAFGMCDADDTISATGTGSRGTYFWGGQFRHGSTPSTYVATTTTPVYSGGGYDMSQGTAANKPFLSRSDSLENRLKSSEDLTAIWTATNATAGATSITEPNDTAQAHYVRQVVEYVKGTSYTFSVDAKPGTNRTWMLIVIADGTGGGAYFNLATGAVGTTLAGTTTSVTDMGSGVYRCSVTYTSAASTSSGGAEIYIASADNTITYNGVAGNSINVYKSQLRRSSTSSTYLATTTYPQYAGLNGRAVPYFPGAATYMSRAFTAGAVRITCFYETFTAPTS